MGVPEIGAIAQLGERYNGIVEVSGSIPLGSTILPLRGFKFDPSGGVAEWLKAADCKSARGSVRRFESYPLHHAWTAAAKPEDVSMGFLRGCSSMVELQPSKLAVWVRSPSPAPIPHSGTALRAAHLGVV